MITTPAVKKATREHFACDTLEGALIENNPTSFGLLGAHWETRAFASDIMAPVKIFGAYLPTMSKVTLALAEDSGWYRVNYDMATKMTKGVHYGYQQGCDFVENPCTELNRDQKRFCSKAQAAKKDRLVNAPMAYCSSDNIRKVACGSDASYNTLMADGCRLRSVKASFILGGISRIDRCDDAMFNDPDYTKNTPNKFYGAFYGNESRCMMSSYSHPSVDGQSLVYVDRQTNQPSKKIQPNCFINYLVIFD